MTPPTLQPVSAEFGVIHLHKIESGLPKGLRALSWDAATAGNHVDFLRAWAAGEERGAWLEGAFGVGKTSLAATASWAFMRSRSLRWVSVPRLQTEMTGAWSRRDIANDLLLRTDALVLDDIDKIQANDEKLARAIFAAVDTRIGAEVSLLVTSNEPITALKRLFPAPWGGALFSRIGGYCPRFVVVGPDRRLART